MAGIVPQITHFSIGGVVFAIACFLPATSFAEPTKIFLDQNCVECHNESERSGGLDLSTMVWEPTSLQNRDRWIQIYDRVKNGEMPPDSKLTQIERENLIKPLGERLQQVISAEKKREGRTVMRRLNRREFENTLHDLLGITTPLQHLLPEDGRLQGFDTVAEGLRISAVQIEKYLEAIDVALNDAIRLTEKPVKFNKRLRFHDEKEVRDNLDTAETFVDPISGARHRRLFRELDNAIVFISPGYSPDNLRQFTPPASGLYRVRISAYAVDSGDAPIAMRVLKSDWKSNHLLHYFNLEEDKPRIVEFTTQLTVNEHLRVNGYGIGNDDEGKSVWNVESVMDWKVPGMAVEWVEVEGPLIDEWPPANLAMIFGSESVQKLASPGGWTNQGAIHYQLAPSDPVATARSSIECFATRAFRRPLQQEEAKPYVELVQRELERGRTYEQAMRVGFRGILVSPRFLMLNEPPGRLDDYALAARLSYLFMSSMPDEELISLAQQGKLKQPEVLRSQVERLLASSRSQAFVSSFVGQWLDVNQIDATVPDAKLYPEYDDILRQSMRSETENFFREMLDRDLPISEIIDSDFAMLDRRLADHYGLSQPFRESRQENFDEQFRRVTLPADSPRGGLMTTAAVLKVTANGTVSSPVLRGAWILRRLLGKPPSPPPPVNAIEPDTRGATTIREQLAKHRDSETCNRCHREIDPPGFALECFDVIGGYRDRYRSVGAGDEPLQKLYGRNIWEYKLGQKVDSSGQTSDGKKFENIREFKELMMLEREQIARNLAGKLITYATGSGVSFADRDTIDQIVDKTRSQGWGTRTLLYESLSSELFQTK